MSDNIDTVEAFGFTEMQPPSLIGGLSQKTLARTLIPSAVVIALVLATDGIATDWLRWSILVIGILAVNGRQRAVAPAAIGAGAPPMVAPAVAMPQPISMAESATETAAVPTEDRRQAVEAAQEALREVLGLAESLGTLASRIGRASHETRANAGSTGDAMARIGGVLAESVDITHAVRDDLSAATTVIAKAQTLTRAADRRTIESQRVVTDLASASEAVERITVTISGVARQTRLLALNATIEAARAGEFGRGFNIVASEVGALAAQTAAFATDIARIIGGVQTKIGDVTAAMSALGASMSEIAAVIDELDGVNERQGSANRQMEEAVRRSAADADGGRESAALLMRAAEDNDLLVRDLERNAGLLSKRSDLLTQRIERILVDFTTLTLLEWEGYFSKFSRQFEDFARARGHEVRIVVASDAEGHPVYLQGPDDLMAALERGGIDIVSPTHSYFGGSAGRLFDLTAPLDLDRVAGWGDVMPSLRQATYATRGRDVHAVPLLGGSVALGYNARLLRDPPTSWACLLDPRFEGKFGLTDGQWETNVYIAAMLAGVKLADVYDPDPALDPAIQKNLDQMVANAGYFWGGMPYSKDMRDLMLVTDYWPGIAAANAEGQDWRFATPREGQPVWFDCISIARPVLADEKKREAAYLLIEFMLSPDIQRQILASLGTSIVNTVAGKSLPADIVQRHHIGDSAFFRPEYLFQPLRPATRKRFEKMWQTALRGRKC